MSEKTIWWDNFEDEPTLTMDEAAPPERYTEVLINPDMDYGYLEVWKADAIAGQTWKHTNVHISFTNDEWNRTKSSHKMIWERRQKAAKERGVKLVRMIRWFIPPAIYSTYYELALRRSNK